MYKGKIPFMGDKLVNYSREWRYVRADSGIGNHQEMEKDGIKWVDNYSFEGVITLHNRINQGRSAKNFTVDILDTTNNKRLTATMFVKDFLSAVIAYGALKGGVIKGCWCFCKRGQNYGVAPDTSIIRNI